MKFSFGGLSITKEDVVLNAAEGRPKCARCDFTCLQRYTMERHVNSVHKKVNPYKCETCGKEMPSRGSLEQHTRNAHKRNPEWLMKSVQRTTKYQAERIMCMHCGKELARGALNAHLKFTVSLKIIQIVF